METKIATNNIIGRKGKPIFSKVAIHPGETLKDEIEARGLKKTDFAGALGILPNHLSELFKGKRNINAQLAIKLENVLGIEAEFWLRLQMRYELTVVRNSEPAKVPLPKYNIMPKASSPTTKRAAR